jgi:hypothetical protein
MFDIIAKHLGVSALLASGFHWAGRAVMPVAQKLLARTDRKFPLGCSVRCHCARAARS